MAEADLRTNTFNKWCISSRTVIYSSMTIKKTVAKKVSPAKTIVKKKGVSNKRDLVCAHGEQCFLTTDGVVIANLVELEQAFSRMADEVFTHHVHADRNDFANWIADVLQDGELAESLRIAKKPASARTIVIRRLKSYHV